jgi:hypothetical protein
MRPKDPGPNNGINQVTEQIDRTLCHQRLSSTRTSESPWEIREFETASEKGLALTHAGRWPDTNDAHRLLFGMGIGTLFCPRVGTSAEWLVKVKRITGTAEEPVVRQGANDAFASKGFDGTGKMITAGPPTMCWRSAGVITFGRCG